MTPAEAAREGAAGSVVADFGTFRVRVSPLVSSDAANAFASWLLSFVLVLTLGADSGGYWPTAWDWTALALLFLCAVILIARTDVRIRRLEIVLPAALLGLTLWGVASVAWSASPTQPLLETQRTLSYAAAAFAALLLARSRSYRSLLAGVWAAVVVVSCYSLLTRLFPERLGFFDSLAGYRLEAPLGYWNALGIYAALGTLLAAGLAARGRTTAVRALAAASTVVLVPTLYFTFSRGAWIALGIGLVTMVALDARRLQLVTSLALVAPWPALAVWHASGSTPLTHIGGGIAAAEHAGDHFIVYLAAIALAAGAVMLAYCLLERRLRVPNAIRIAYAVLLLAALVGVFVAATVRYGSPVAIARQGYDSFLGPPRAVTNGNLNTRLDSLALGQRIPQWKVAWHEYVAHPWLGSGLGSYLRFWDEYRPIQTQVINVHNLYLETLAELGPLGLGLLLVALLAPLVAVLKARRRALVPAAAAAYVAFLAHAAVDWDWQMPAVTLAALFCASGLLIAARRTPSSGAPLRARWRGVALGLVVVLGAFAFVGLRGNQAIAASQKAATATAWAKSAAAARSARFWAPWSSQPWQLLGEAQAAVGNRAEARASFEHALAKNRQDWSIWLDLALVSTGAERKRAFEAAAKLNPLSPQIPVYKTPARAGSR